MLAEGMSAGHCVVTVRVACEEEASGLLSEPEFSAEISLMVRKKQLNYFRVSKLLSSLREALKITFFNKNLILTALYL